MEKTTKNSQKLLIGLLVAILVAMSVQTVALVILSTNASGTNVIGTNTPVVNSTALPNMAGGC